MAHLRQEAGVMLPLDGFALERGGILLMENTPHGLLADDAPLFSPRVPTVGELRLARAPQIFTILPGEDQ